MNWEYSLWLAVALALGSATVFWLGRQHGVEGKLLREALLVLLGGTLLGARLAALLWAMLETGTPREMESLFLLLLQRGNSFQGALLGGGVALALWAWRGRYPGWLLADLMAIGLCFGGTLAWLGALRQGIAYGAPQVQGTLVYPLPDLHGLVLPRWPVQAVGAGAFLLLGLLLLIVHRRFAWPSGVLALLALWAIHLSFFLLGFFRADPTILVGTFRLGQLLALLWLGGAALLLPSRWQKREAAR